MIRSKLLTSLFMLLCVSISSTWANTIWVGASSIDITPKLPAALDGQMNVRIAQKAETPLLANVIVLESKNATQSESVTIFVTCDIVTVPTELKLLIQEEVKKRLPSIDVRKIMINASHTHTGGVVRDGWYDIPKGVTQVKDYQRFISTQVAKAIKSAWDTRTAGKVAWGLNYAQVAFNRRAVYESGNAQMYGKTNTDDFRAIEGYEDQSINSLFFWNNQNKLIAIAVNLASPAQIVEGRTVLNADYWHPLRNSLKKEFSNDIVLVGWIGAAGDQTPRPMFEQAATSRMLALSNGSFQRNASQSQGFSTEAYMDAIAKRITKAIVETFDLVKNDQYSSLPLKHEVETFKVAARIVTLVEKEACLKSIAEDNSTEERRKQFSRRIAWNQEVVDRYDQQQSNPTPQYEIEAHFIRLGDIAICSNPFELFTEYGIQIKARSKALQTFVVQLVGPGTYIPTKKAIEGGHYSAIVQSNRVGYQGGQQLVDKTVEFVNRMW